MAAHENLVSGTPVSTPSGQKTENGRVIRIELNGVLIQEDVELTGPTRGSHLHDEKALGPLRFQGDHGAVAFRNIRYVAYDKPRPELLNLKYAVYKGKYEKEPDYDKTAPESEGATKVLSASVNHIPKRVFDSVHRYPARFRTRRIPV